jgi:hypothetical protein
MKDEGRIVALCGMLWNGMAWCNMTKKDDGKAGTWPTSVRGSVS